MDNNLIEGTTSTGFHYLIDARRLNDRRVMRLLVKMRDETIPELEMLDIVIQYQNMILGEKQAERLEEHVADLNDGFCTAEKYNAEVIEIQNAVKEIKNS